MNNEYRLDESNRLIKNSFLIKQQQKNNQLNNSILNKLVDDDKLMVKHSNCNHGK